MTVDDTDGSPVFPLPDLGLIHLSRSASVMATIRDRRWSTPRIWCAHGRARRSSCARSESVRPIGTVRNRMLYRPFGGRIVNEGQSLEHGFAGGAVLPGGSLYVLGPRLYHADSGHFYEPDPWLGDPQEPRTMQSYGYALGDPLRYTDPTGLQPVCDRPGGCGSALPPLFGNPFGSFPGPVQPRWLHEPVNRATNVPRAPDVEFGDRERGFIDEQIGRLEEDQRATQSRLESVDAAIRRLTEELERSIQRRIEIEERVFRSGPFTVDKLTEALAQAIGLPGGPVSSMVDEDLRLAQRIDDLRTRILPGLRRQRSALQSILADRSMRIRTFRDFIGETE